MMHPREMDPLKLRENCRFCFPPDKERILKKTKNFYIMLSLGPIVEGHMLIITKKHIPSFQRLPKHLVAEFLAIKGAVKKILSEEYGDCIFFEHNLSSTSITKRETPHDYHAHLHCIPTDVDILEGIKEVLTPIHVDNWYSFGVHAGRFSESIYYEDNNEDMYIFSVNRHLRKQFLRYLLAKKLGVPERADWTIYLGWADIFTAKKKLTPLFEKEELK
jgi:diadenosine tetraphosphate (Ap4A) HIT family hydrolase